ncbi:hypothetical protein PC114_g21929 [Phytophthora cactorum]|uniref:Uncharacterized protein n=1 Tax=Phytophthora cactorum TaxID=29920 RepID=A0A8T1AUI8_9STRA|nr:hypothetical protein PC112_g20066 [Phytophthora cactorum]KAG2880720.1 hypothetical protein PC114_g21929 [Phytophthora cactorum]KAG2890442.1 hypothetical protein PC115_g19499 [Phytophthora cactorum]
MRLYQHPLLRIQVLKSTVIKRRLRRGSTCRGQDVNQDRSSPRVATSSQVDASAYVDEDSALIASTHNDSSSVASVEVTVVTKLGGGFRR